MKFTVEASREFREDSFLYTCSFYNEIDGIDFDDFDIMINKKYKEAIEFMDSKYEYGHFFTLEELNKCIKGKKSEKTE